MPFKEDLLEKLSKVEDAEVRASLANEIEQLHVLDVGGLKEAKETILKEKKELKSKLEDTLKMVEGYGGKTPEQIAELEKNIEELRANPGDDVKLKQIEDKYKLQMEQLKTNEQSKYALKEEELLSTKNQIADLNNEINRGLSQQALVESLERVGVKADLKPILAKALAADVTVELDSNGNREVKIKHAGINFGIKEGLDAWAGAPENKPYIGAINNRGAGANGSSGTGTGPQKPFSEMSYKEKVELHKSNPEAYRQLEANSK